MTIVSCSAPSEQPLLTQFFATSRLRDLTALGNFATVAFEPATDGVVTSFEITGVVAVRGADGQPTSKDVLIAAPVRLPDGSTVRKSLVISMQRGLPGSDPHRWGGWMITAVRDGSASSTPRP